MIASKQMTNATTYQEQMCQEQENNYQKNKKDQHKKQQVQKQEKKKFRHHYNFDMASNKHDKSHQKRMTNRTTGNTKDREARLSTSLLE